MTITPRKKRLGFLGVSLLLSSIFTFAVTASAPAGVVRGRLVRNGYPAPHVGVSLYNQNMGRSSVAYTDREGMYYLYNVPPGHYYLEVWVSNQPLVYQIVVYNQSYTDIPPIGVP